MLVGCLYIFYFMSCGRCQLGVFTGYRLSLSCMRRAKNTHFAGSISVVLVVIIVVALIVGIAFWTLTSKNQSASSPTSSVPSTSTSSSTTSAADSPSTIKSPDKISTSDGKQHFYYGAPAGQNNASPKKIIITLHGTEGSAQTDYEVWRPFVEKTDFALAALNWWDGSGDSITDYSTPEKMNSYIHDFLSAQGYTKNDLVVFQGFSRGSANSFSIVAFDQASSNPLIKVAVSSSGSVEPGYFTSTTSAISNRINTTNIFSKVGWILACGGKDANPNRDGCPAMEQSKQFVTSEGATVLGLLQDANAGHGALTTSSLGLAGQMFDLIEQKY